MATIVDIVQLREQGLSKRAVAKRLGISRDTVSKYWDCVQLKPGQLWPAATVDGPLP
ncbi:MAG: helix-turn-helix domain-containing protein [Bacillota bacterium]